MEPHRGRGVLKVGLLAAALLLAVGPAAADDPACPLRQADGSVVNVNGTVVGVMTETIERVEVIVDDSGEPHRMATAKEVGTLSHGCGNLAVLEGTIKVQPAVSDVSLTTLSGPISGSVKFYPSTSGGVLKATLLGTLDFTPALRDKMPFVNVSGEWTVQNSSLAGSFAGVALIPVSVLDVPTCTAVTGFCYVDVTGALGGGLVPLTLAEAQPAPAAKFVVTLFR